MTLSTPIRPKPLRGLRLTRYTRREPARPAAPQEAVTPFPSAQPVPAQSVLMVDLASPEGRIWWAVGVGDTLAEALAFAQDSCPTDTNWQPIRWNDLYGD
jgi:hypothetical protein